MVDVFSYINHIPMEYSDEFKEYFKGNYIKDEKIGYEKMIRSGITIPSIDLLIQIGQPSLILETESNTISKNRKSQINTELNLITKEIYPELDFNKYKITFELLTHSLPMKINFLKNDKELNETMFIKKPSTNRVIGKEMYNFIQEEYKNIFVFNTEFLAVKGITGNTLEKIDEDVYLANDTYRENLIRSFVRAKFIGLGDITTKKEDKTIKYENKITTKSNDEIFIKRNLLVTHENKILFVDYEKMFREDSTNYLQDYKNIPNFFEGMLEAYKDEHRKIASNVDKNRKKFFEFLEIIKDSKDVLDLTVNQRVKKFLGSTNLIEHYNVMLDSYSKM
jgi:hypothetical protein